MKFLLSVILFTFVACGTPTNNSDNSVDEKGMDPQIVLDVMNDYVENCNTRKDSDKWVENQKFLTEDFKKEYKKMMKEAWEEDPEIGLGFDPILNAQDFPEKGFEIKSVDSKKGLVTLQGIDWLDFVLTTQITEVNGKWLLDGAGVIRIPRK